MDNKKNPARNGVCSKQQDSKKDLTGSVRQVPKNARRRENKGSYYQEQNSQLRNTNAGSQQQQQQHLRNNNERRSKWNKTSRHHVPDGEATGLAAVEEDEILDDHEEILLDQADWDSVIVSGSKKHNLNHLLNFNYAPRLWELQQRVGRQDQPQQLKRGQKNRSTGSFFKKDQFLQANCNFIVREAADYGTHGKDPDAMVDWDLVEEVVIRSSEEPQCPICLFPPVAAKMTKCGHVYCWSCILHYLALSDKEWRKCPICYDAVCIKDLRSTVAWPYHAYQLNETIDFQLMCRRKDSLRVMKMSEQENEERFPHLFDVREHQVCHSKLIMANKEEVAAILDRERCELQAQMQTDGPEGSDCPETMFISQALELLERRANEMKGNSPVAVPLDDNRALPHELAATATGESAAAEEFYFFYQAVDGQHLYMHSINLRMLQAQFGELSNCPLVLSGRIVQREHFSVNEVLRKRSKYLQHLPLTSIITVVEVNFRDEVSMFSAEVLAQFSEELRQRKMDRQRRERDEMKRERKINDHNERQMSQFMTQSSGFARQAEDFYPFLASGEDVQEAGTLGGDTAEASAGGLDQPFSFAKMLQCASEMERTQPYSWPTLTGAGLSVRDNKPKTSKMSKHFPNLLNTIDIQDEQHRNCHATPQPPREIVSTPKRATGGGGAEYMNSVSGATKKTPKKKQQLLFSTDMSFNRN